MDCYLSQLLKMVNELDALQNIQSDIASLNETVAALNTTAEALSSTVDSLNTSISSISSTVGTINTNVSTVKSDVSTVKSDVSTVKSDVSTVKTDVSTIKTAMDSIGGNLDKVLSAVSDLGNREDYTDYFASGTVVLDVSDNDGYLAYTVNLGEYFSVGYTISQMYTTDQETTAQTHIYPEGNLLSKVDDTYLKMKPEAWIYKGEDHYNFIVELTNSAVETYPELVNIYVIGRFATRTKCYILTESQYELLDNWESDNPYKLTYPLTLPTSSSSE